MPRPDACGRIQRVQWLPNPATFRFNGVTIGATSLDVLFAIRREEIADGMPGDQLKRIMSHVLEQQSYYPLFPPYAPLPEAADAPMAAAEMVCIDMNHYDAMRLPLTPDIMLVPSRLQKFGKVHGRLPAAGPPATAPNDRTPAAGFAECSGLPVYQSRAAEHAKQQRYLRASHRCTAEARVAAGRRCDTIQGCGADQGRDHQDLSTPNGPLVASVDCGDDG